MRRLCEETIRLTLTACITAVACLLYFYVFDEQILSVLPLFDRSGAFISVVIGGMGHGSELYRPILDKQFRLLQTYGDYHVYERAR